MAQTTKSPRKSPRKSPTSRNGSRATSSGSSKSAASKRPRSTKSSKRTSSNGNRAKSTSASRPRTQSRSKAQSRNGAGSIKDTAIGRTKIAGHAAAEAASKAKVPLIAGGTALAGAAAGILIKDRLGVKRSKNPLKRLPSASMLKPGTSLNLGKLDVGKVKSVAERVSAYGQQASDIASAVEKTQKKNG